MREDGTAVHETLANEINMQGTFDGNETDTTWGLGVHAKADSPETFDTVISGGRVMDPETQRDEIADVGIRHGKITRISNTPLTGKLQIDASGMVVAPGFIDIHSHTPTRLGEHLNVLDGITTQLDLEAGRALLFVAH